MTTAGMRLIGGHVVTGGRGGDGTAEVRLAEGRVAASASEHPDDRVIDATGMTLLPGWIDLQVNGAFGLDLTSDPASLWQLAGRLPRTGVTAFLPTLVSPDPDLVARAIAVWQAGPPPGWAGAVPLGWHVEGPFLAETHRGTHPAASLRPLDVEVLRTWAASGAIRMVTLAPELDQAEEGIAALRQAGVVVAAGHTGADHLQAARAVDAGVQAVTHVFNAMRPLHHRDPGLVAVALTDPRLSLGVIADGVHLDPVILSLLHRSAGQRIHLVTDAMAAAGLGHGVHRLGRMEITVGPDGPRNAAGDLAGSAATYDQVVRVWRAATGAAAQDLARVTSGTAAALVGTSARGHLATGARADLTAIDADGGVVLTVVGGQVQHHTPTSGASQGGEGNPGGRP